MYGMKLQNRLAMLGLVVVSVVASSCAGSGAGDKAGGSGEPVVLRMATVNGDLDFTPQIRYLVDRVEDLSGGNLRIDMAYEVGAFAKNAETEVVRGVAGGRFDLGFVGTHVFESLGVDSFQALTAPMLIDSYSLERAVIESGITDQMMQGLDDVGVTGLGIMAGALRKPIGVERPLLGPADWRGITFGIFKSEGQEQAIRALATPLQVIGDARDKALRNESIDGFESSLLAYRLNGQEGEAPYVTANVNLWPQTLAVFANPDLLADLTAEQRAWLQQAADDAAARSAALADTDAHSIKIVCDAGARFAEASETDLASIQQALSPVYADLKQDPETDGFIEQIQALKEFTTPEPALAIPTGCTGKAPEHLTASEGSAPAHLNGTYRYTITKEDVIKHDMGDPEEYPSTNTVTLEGGKFSIRGTRGGFSGTYTVEKDQITFDVPEFMARFTFTFSVDDDGLHLTPVQPMDPGDAFEFSVHPWTRIR